MKTLKSWLQRQSHLILLPIVALLLSLVFVNLPYLGKPLENMTINMRFQVRAPFDGPMDKRIVLVGVDQQSIDYWGSWPWSRTVFADFLNLIYSSKFQPKAVAMDIFFTDTAKKYVNHQSIVDPSADIALGEAVAKLPVVITGAVTDPASIDTDLQNKAEARTSTVLASLPSIQYTTPLTHINGNVYQIRGQQAANFPVDPLLKQSFFGFVDDAPSEIDGVRRTIPLIVRVQDKVFPSLALQTLIQVLHIDPDSGVIINVGKNVVLKTSSKSWTIPIQPDGEYLINFRRQDSTTLDNLSMYELNQNMEDHATQGAPIDSSCMLNQKIVVIGETALGLTDLDPTPLDGTTPLVRLNVDVINNVLKNDYLWRIPVIYIIIGFLIVSWATLFSLQKSSIVWAVGIPITVVVIYIFVAFIIFWWNNALVDVMWPVLGYTGLNFESNIRRWREEQKSKQAIRHLFSRMVAPEVLSHLLDRPETLKLGGTTRNATVFFSDIRDFTSLSEGMGQEELVNQLNEYFERMVKCIKTHNGTFHKFIGDAIMASWSAIEATSNGVQEDAINAVYASLEMRRELKELNVERAKKNLMPLRIGIGLNHGPVLAGQIGAVNSVMEFTLMGDTVNVASRLEGITKMFHTDMIIGDSLRELVGDKIFARPLGLVTPKGKSIPSMIYEVLCENTRPHDSSFAVIDLPIYQQGLDAFYERKFTEALAIFQGLLKTHEKDYTVQYYIEWIERLISEPPPEDWDGRIELHSK